MTLFPERSGRGTRPFLIVALVLSLLVHLAGGEAWLLLHRHVAAVLAKLMPRAIPTPDIAALSDTITIEKRTVPPTVQRSRPQPRPQPKPRQRAVERPPLAHAIPVPTLPPLARALPTTAPTAAPTIPPVTPPPAPRARLHRPPPAPTVAPRTVAQAAPGESRAPQPSHASGAAFSPQQLAALDAQFSRTIAQAQRSLTDVPPQHRRPSTTMKRYQAVMAGSRSDLASAQGQCRAIQTWYRGPVVWHYMDCEFVYTDGFTEHVDIPWPQHFSRSDDPVDHPYKSYPVTDPPDGWTLPHPFPFSRLVCIYYKSECRSLIDRERANGDPDYAVP